MRTVALIIIGVIVTLGVSGGATYAAYQYSKNEQTKEMSALRQDLADQRSTSENIASERDSLKSQYDTLSNNYDTLYNEAAAYMNTYRYQAPQSVSCSSNVIGNSVYTNCY